MSKSIYHKIKILYILKFLMEETDKQHPLSTQEIIDKLAAVDIPAERKAIYDDIAALQRFGIDIEKTAAGSRGYYIASRDFESAELKLLVDAVQASRFITGQKNSQLIKKLSSLTSRHEADLLSRQVYISNRVRTMDDSVYTAIDTVHLAIAKNTQIKFKYFEWSPKKEKVLRHGGKIYRVSPWTLCWQDENYYLIAFDDEAGIIKHFRVDKMVNVEFHDEKRRGRELMREFDMSRYSQKAFGMYGGSEETVTLECTSDLAGVIIDRFGEDITFFGGGDTFSVAVSVIISNNFYGWLMQFGGKIKVKAPGYVRDGFANLLTKMAEDYK